MNLERKLAVACLFGGVLLLFVALGLFLAGHQMTPAISYSLVAGVALLISYGLLAPTAVLDLAKRRQARFGSLSVLVSAIVVGVLAMINVLAAHADQTIDLTGAQRYTLSPKTIAVLKQLDSDVTITGFFRPGSETSDLDSGRRLLAQYEKASRRIKASVVNPDTHLADANRLGVTINGSFVVQYRDKKPAVLLLGSQGEADFTSAILKLEAAHTPMICWATGEEERSIADTQDRGYSQARSQLESDNFTLKEVILSQSPQVPADCDIVAVIAVQRKIPDAVVQALQRYVDSGGRLLLAVDPWTPQDALDSANAIVKPYGASFQNGLIVESDPTRHATDEPDTPVVVQFGDSPVTRPLKNSFTFFPLAGGIAQADAPGVNAVKLAESGQSSYQIISPRNLDNAGLRRQPGDRTGPFTMMETLERPSTTQPAAGAPSNPTGRVILVGTSYFGENFVVGSQAGYNLQLLLGSFDWLAGNDQLIALPPKPPAEAPLPLTEQDYTVNFAIVVLLVPALVALAGLAVFLRRRREYSPV